MVVLVIRSKFLGTELSGKTLAIIGCGRIGQTVSQGGPQQPGSYQAGVRRGGLELMAAVCLCVCACDACLAVSRWPSGATPST